MASKLVPDLKLSISVLAVQYPQDPLQIKALLNTIVILN